jgi:hypothetical protein
VSRRRFTGARQLLGDLLNRYEANPAAARLFAYLDFEAFGSVAQLDACLDELAMVERAGGITVRRRRGGGVDHVESIRLEDAAAVYRHLGRTPAPEDAGRAIAALQTAFTATVVQEVLEEVRSAWARNVRALGLAPGETKRLMAAVVLAEALVARATDPIPADYRTFARAAVGDSKALERLAPAVAALARRLEPSAISAEMETPEEIIGAFGVTRLPQPFLVSGPLALDANPLPSLNYIGIPPEDIERLTVARPPTYILIVENFTSFIRHVREVNKDLSGVVMFSGGFPSRPTLKGITRLVSLTAAPAHHWGDIDLGGLRIFLHLERALGEIGRKLQPHLMTEALLRSHGGPSPRRNWIRAVRPDEGSGVRVLWNAIATGELDLDLEQEAVTPQPPSRA